jgi:hypothetical protein
MTKAAFSHKNYIKALQHLAVIKYPLSVQSIPGEYAFLKAACYFMLGCYRQAEVHSQPARKDSPTAGIHLSCFKKQNRSYRLFIIRTDLLCPD